MVPYATVIIGHWPVGNVCHQGEHSVLVLAGGGVVGKLRVAVQKGTTEPELAAFQTNHGLVCCASDTRTTTYIYILSRS